MSDYEILSLVFSVVFTVIGILVNVLLHKFDDKNEKK